MHRFVIFMFDFIKRNGARTTEALKIADDIRSEQFLAHAFTNKFMCELSVFDQWAPMGRTMDAMDIWCLECRIDFRPIVGRCHSRIHVYNFFFFSAVFCSRILAFLLSCLCCNTSHEPKGSSLSFIRAWLWFLCCFLMRFGDKFHGIQLIRMIGNLSLNALC